MLLSVNGIQEAVVLAVSEGGLPELCAYYKADSGLKGSELRKRLSETLPSHMLPAYFVQVDRIPLTANGKTDKTPSRNRASAKRRKQLQPCRKRNWRKSCAAFGNRHSVRIRSASTIISSITAGTL